MAEGRLRDRGVLRQRPLVLGRLGADGATRTGDTAAFATLGRGGLATSEPPSSFTVSFNNNPLLADDVTVVAKVDYDTQRLVDRRTRRHRIQTGYGST